MPTRRSGTSEGSCSGRWSGRPPDITGRYPLIDRGEREIDADLRQVTGFVIKSLTELTAVFASVGRGNIPE